MEHMEKKNSNNTHTHTNQREGESFWSSVVSAHPGDATVYNSCVYFQIRDASPKEHM